MNTKNGRGRGRGRGLGTHAASGNPWSLNSNAPKVVPSPGPPPVSQEKKMIDMKAKYGKLIDNLSESDSSDEETHNEEILSKLTKSFDDALESRYFFSELN